MYCPAHGYEDVGDVGDRLGSHSGVTEENVDDMEELAEEHGIVGHAQKVASARDDKFRTQILRRSEGVATDEVGGSAFNFSSVQTDTRKFVDVRRAMSVDEYDLDVPDDRHGIVDYLGTVSRSTFLVRNVTVYENVGATANGVAFRVVDANGSTEIQQTVGSDFLSQESRVFHLGLGDRERTDPTVVWPDGTERTYEDVAANQQLRVTENGTETVVDYGE